MFSEIYLLIPSLLEMPAFFITSKNCMDVVRIENNFLFQKCISYFQYFKVKLITFNLHSIISQFNNTNTLISSQVSFNR